MSEHILAPAGGVREQVQRRTPCLGRASPRNAPALPSVSRRAEGPGSSGGQPGGAAQEAEPARMRWAGASRSWAATRALPPL